MASSLLRTQRLWLERQSADRMPRVRYFVRPILAFLLAPLSVSAMLLAIGLIRGSETYHVEQLLLLATISYVSELFLGVPAYALFRLKNINAYLSYIAVGALIGIVAPLSVFAPCAFVSNSCGAIGVGLLTILALGALFGMLSAIVFRVILGRHTWRNTRST